MYSMSHHHHHRDGVTIPVIAITVFFVLLGTFASAALGLWEPYLVLGMMLLLGLPHGATDHGLYLALRPNNKQLKKSSFYIAYLAVIAAYGLVWFLLPLLAFAIFMLLSVYHFGQSNWVTLKYGNGIVARMHYLIWGIGILLTPILLHAEEAIAIVTSMTNTQLLVVPSQQKVHIFIAAMAVLNAVAIGVLRWRSLIDNKRFLIELLSYALLIALFFTNSLLLGFTVYFVFWHSLASGKDQLQFFKARLSPARRRQLYTEVSMTVAGALLFCLIVWFGPGPEAALQPAMIGGVFIFISLLTLPHMLLVEELYARWSPTLVAEPAEELKSEKLILTINHSDLAKQPAGKELTITH